MATAELLHLMERAGFGANQRGTLGPRLAKLVELAMQAEREECARLCDDADKSTHPADLADRIRARGKK